jgi:hypothetical protein
MSDNATFVITVAVFLAYLTINHFIDAWKGNDDDH